MAELDVPKSMAQKSCEGIEMTNAWQRDADYSRIATRWLDRLIDPEMRCADRVVGAFKAAMQEAGMASLIDRAAPVAECKLRHWCGVPAIYDANTAPVLEFVK